jgi:hypothetical protein
MSEHEERQGERQIGAEEDTEKVEVEVGGYSVDGTFLGERLRFAAEEVGSWTDFSMARSQDDRGVTYTLYKLPGGKYRVHELSWSRWQGEGSEALLYPVEQDEEAAYGGAFTYDAYTEDDARQAWPHLFAALGMPNVRDID